MTFDITAILMLTEQQIMVFLACIVQQYIYRFGKEFEYSGAAGSDDTSHDMNAYTSTTNKG